MVQTYTRKADFGYKAGSPTARIHRLAECYATREGDGGSLRFYGTWECGRRCHDIALVADPTLFARDTCEGCGVYEIAEYVYFAERNGLIKIGWTRNLPRRMKELDALLLAAVKGGRAVEKHMHAIFAPLAVVGEWHKDDGSIFGALDTWLENEKIVAGQILTGDDLRGRVG